MYNPITEAKIKNIPQIGNIAIDRLPQELTRIFAQIVSIRKSFIDNENILSDDLINDIETLLRLTNNLETILLSNNNQDKKESIAFVAATAHYLLLQVFNLHSNYRNERPNFTIDTISPGVSAMLLFLIANSQADAAEVAAYYSSDRHSNIPNKLLHFIKCLAIGDLKAIAEANIKSRNIGDTDLQTFALSILWENILQGIQDLALRLLGRKIQSGSNYFDLVINLSTYSNDSLNYRGIYSGPLHLAKLLRNLEGDILKRGIINIPAPTGVDEILWFAFLKVMAESRPYLWENHAAALNEKFLDLGTSAILTFPTGAGKSTLSELKIATALLSNRKVLYIVPTHALEDQVNANLKAIFNDFLFSHDIEIDDEYTEIKDIQSLKILVMTPERCLTLLGINERFFSDIGLVVFDEFHLIHGTDNRRDRRSVEAMFCLTSLFAICPHSDYLLISAMVENSDEISKWVSSVTGRRCVSFNSSWKPTRQMLGCLVFQETEIIALRKKIAKEKLSPKTKNPPKSLKDSAIANPYVFFSLKTIWESEENEDYYAANIFQEQVKLGINNYWSLSTNRNEIAASLASHFSSLGIKTLVFVDSPRIAVSTAQKISTAFDGISASYKKFRRTHSDLFESLQYELGDLQHSYISNDGNVGIHHGNMLSLERRINELWFKQKKGLSIIVATATLAQGINLPAEVVIIAGDDRYSEISGNRETIPPQELLNAAGRAGRAGMSAQGIVILIPGEIVTINDETISTRWWQLKEQVFSKSDQCLTISDPLEYFLDSLQDNGIHLTVDQKNILYRLKPPTPSVNQAKEIFSKSFYAYKLSLQSKYDSFTKKIEILIKNQNYLQATAPIADWVKDISVKTGMNPIIIESLGNAIDTVGIEEIIEYNIVQNIKWLCNWITTKEALFTEIFSKERTIVNLHKILLLDNTTSTSVLLSNFKKIPALLIKYVQGETFKSIDKAISNKSDNYLGFARTFILKIIPDISFVFGIYSMIIIEKMKNFDPDYQIPFDIKVLASCIREGFDSSNKLFYKLNNRIDSRVQAHLLFEQEDV